MYAAELRAGSLSRREFLTRATALGVSSGTAYGIIGLAAPAARAQEARGGGTLRVQMDIIAMKDPRLWDWSEMANFGRGWLEYLVEYQADGTFRPMLLDSWQVNDDATEYVLRVRPGVTWNNDDALTAEHVAYNFRRWADPAVEGNSMASRFANIVDFSTGEVRDGTLEVVDDTTLRVSLPEPNIALIANLADYPAAIVHPSYDGGNPIEQPIGTGPYLPAEYVLNERGVLVRNREHDWWGQDVYGGATLDRIEYLDYGTDPATWLAAIEAGEVDMLYESVGEFIAILDTLELVKSEAVTANTIVIRPNQRAEVGGRRPYTDVRVRRALQLACSNEILLELGYQSLGIVAANHHVCPIHPEYAEIGPAEHDPDLALALMEEAGMADFEHELVSLDDGYQRDTCDAVAAQLRDAGLLVRRTILPSSSYVQDWQNFAFSATEWSQRPLGVQVLALAYRSGEPWNETGFSNARFDQLLAEAMAIAEAERRSVVMAELEQLLREEGVIIQPYWRSTYRHFREGVTGAEMHPMFEIYPYRLGWAGMRPAD
ncbi:ABC transporter substrate-binding protein [Roseitranquillus sediminis]|uniref:ABC transporter substrate-binding protein n=1 Tax=Roseitranquillus sediminis TaxID=2809051 RepID=UPI001D0C8FA5|nr:ABC transporter substrate-binding protein [Roseitranquillus sediminis]